MNYSKYLQTRLKELRDKYNLLDENEIEEEVLLANINSIRNVIFEILNYSVNHFPWYTGNRRDIDFPILGISESKEALLANQLYLKIRDSVGDKATEYVRKAYDVIFNEKYDNCLILLDPSSKHRNSDQVAQEKPEVQAKYESFGGPVVKENIYGGFSIGNGFQSNGPSMEMSGCVFLTNEGVTLIESLRTVKIQGNSLLINKNDQEIQVLIKPFLKKCLDCCEDILKIWSVYQ